MSMSYSYGCGVRSSDHPSIQKNYMYIYCVLAIQQINFHPMDVNKYRYIQTPIGLLIFEVIGHVYAVQCEVLYWIVGTRFPRQISSALCIVCSYNSEAYIKTLWPRSDCSGFTMFASLVKCFWTTYYRIQTQ